MRVVWFVYGLLVIFLLGFMFSSLLRKSDWMRERNEEIWGFICKKTGGRNFRMENWTAHCQYVVDQKGRVLWP